MFITKDDLQKIFARWAEKLADDSEAFQYPPDHDYAENATKFFLKLREEIEQERA